MYKKNFKINYLKEIFKDRCFSNNFYLFIFLFAFFIVAIDLGSESAVEKNEIGVVLGIFEDSEPDMVLSALVLSHIERPFLFEIPLVNIFPQENNSKFSITDRGPPEI